MYPSSLRSTHRSQTVAMLLLTLVMLPAPPGALAQFVLSVGGQDSDIGRSIAVDASGTIYLTGYFQGTVDFDPSPEATENRTSSGDFDFFVASYDASGAFRFAHTFGGGTWDWGTDIAVDAAGNSYVTGHFEGTIDFDPDPNATANRTSNGGEDIFIASYDASGAFRFAHTFGGPENDEGSGIAVDAAGNSYIAGDFEGTVDFDPAPNATANRTSKGLGSGFVASYDAAGAFRFALEFGGPGGTFVLSSDIAVDDASNSYTTGLFTDQVDFDPDPGRTVNRTADQNFWWDGFVVSYDAAGAFRFVQTFGGEETDEGVGIAVDAEGNSYVTGFFQDTADFDSTPGQSTIRTAEDLYDIVLVSYDTAGNLRFVNTFGTDLIEGGQHIAVDAEGNSYVTGYVYESPDFDPDPNNTETRTISGLQDFFVASYDATGAFRFVHTYGGMENDQGNAIALDTEGNIHILGFFEGIGDFDPDPNRTEERTSNGEYDVFVVRYDATGNFVSPPLVYTLTVISENPATGIPIQVTPADNGGLSDDNTGFSRQYNEGTSVTLTAPDLSGDNTFLHWLLDGTPTSTMPVVALQIAADHTATAVYQSPPAPPDESTLASSVSVNGDIVEATLSWEAVEGALAYHVHLSTDADFSTGTVADVTLEATEFQVPEDALALEMDYQWRVRASRVGTTGPWGAWSAAATFSTATATAGEEETDVPASFALYGAYPNPFNPTTTIRYDLPAPGSVRLAIYDALGREVEVLVHETQPAGRHATTFDARTRPSGVYVYRLETTGQTLARTMLLMK